MAFAALAFAGLLTRLLARLLTLILTGLLALILSFALLPRTGHARLHATIGVIGQFLLVTQHVAKFTHRAVLPFTLALPLTFDNLHVFHKLAELFHQLGGLGGFTFFHQLLKFIQHLLQLVARHHLALHLALLLFIARIALRFFGQFAHVFAKRLLHFLHQLVDLFGRGTVFNRLLQAVLRALHPVKRGLQVPLFDHQGDGPQLFGDCIAVFDGQGSLLGLKVADQDAKVKKGTVVTDKALGRVGYGFQKLDSAGGVDAVPQDIAPHFDKGSGKGVEKALAGQGYGIGF